MTDPDPRLAEYWAFWAQVRRELAEVMAEAEACRQKGRMAKDGWD